MPETHFITAPAFYRKRVFQNELYGELLTDVLMRWRQAFQVLLHDYVIMPDHVHLLITTYGDATAEVALHGLQQEFAKELAQRYGYEGEVWEPQVLDRPVRNAQECADWARKIHTNPVRLGLSEEPGEFRMSSKASYWLLDPLPEAMRPMPPS